MLTGFELYSRWVPLDNDDDDGGGGDDNDNDDILYLHKLTDTLIFSPILKIEGR